LDVEPLAKITDGEMNLVCVLGQLYFDPFHPAVLNGIVESFL